MKCTINGSKRSQPKISGNNRKVFSIGSQKIGSSKKKHRRDLAGPVVLSFDYGFFS